MKKILTFIQKQNKNRDRGVALLFVILLTSVLLLVAIGISNISYRETTFSLEAQDSDLAFFAADTGIECGLYLDNRGVFSGTGLGDHTCAGAAPLIIDTAPTFQFVLPLGPKQCALVNVNKAYDGDGTGADNYTYIQSVGYNVKANDTDHTVCVSGTPGLRTVTRGLSLQYSNDGVGGTGGGGGTGGTSVLSTLSAADITQTTATLNGQYNSAFGGPSTFTNFAYGPTTAYGSWTGTAYFGSVTGPFPFHVDAPVTGLVCGTTYHYSVVGTDPDAGTSEHGADKIFTTAGC